MTTDSEMPDSDNLIDLNHYRKMVKNFIDMRRYETARFWAEKVCVLSQNDPRDVYMQAHSMFLLKEYHRAAHIIRFHGLEKTHIPCYNLLLESLYEAKELNEAVSIINTVDIDLLASTLISQQLDTEGNAYEDQSSTLGDDDSYKNELLASVSFLKGKIYEALDNRGLAMDFYVQALHKSIYCYEALEALVKHEMLMAWEEKELMEHLPVQQQSTPSDAKLIKKLYESKLKKYYESIGPLLNTEETPIGDVSSLKIIKELTENIQKNSKSDVYLPKQITPKFVTPTHIMSPAHKVLEDIKNNTPFSLQVSLSRASSLVNESARSNRSTETSYRNRGKKSDNSKMFTLNSCYDRIEYSTDLMASEAEKLFYNCEYEKALRILNELLRIDPFHISALTVQIGCLVEYNDYNKLFYVAHKLVDRYPDLAISWYAVGCYYDLIGKSDPARRYLSKATSLDRLYGPAWLAYGHSFAKENEHDQAMAAYFKATQLMRGCHLPLLYIGVECGLTKNLELAEKFFYQAMSIAPLDVFVLHELGVIKYEFEYYESAEEVFRATVQIITERAKQNQKEISARWEPLFNNLGHCCRKTRKFKEALEFHEQALLLKPQSAQTLTAIGFVHSLMGNLDLAITYFHKSLAINRDCIVTSTILKTCLEDYMNDDYMIDEICGHTSANITQTTSMFSRSSTTKRVLPSEDSPPLSFNQTRTDMTDRNISTNSRPETTMDMSVEME